MDGYIQNCAKTLKSTDYFDKNPTHSSQSQHKLELFPPEGLMKKLGHTDTKFDLWPLI